MAYKDFQAAQVLTAQEVDEYLMRQTVMVFDSAAARDLAIASPTEGMIVYLKDTNILSAYDGSAWGGIAAEQVRADPSHGDGGAVLRRRVTGSNTYTGLLTANMAGQEAVIVSNGTTTLLSCGTGGEILANVPGSSNGFSVQSWGMQVIGAKVNADQPYVQARGNGANWFQPPSASTGNLRNGAPSGFSWVTSRNVGNHFNAATGAFVAPYTGVYLACFSAYQQNFGGTGYIHWLFSVGGTVAWNGGQTPYNIYGYNSGTYADGVDVMRLIYVTAGNGIGIQGHMGGDERFYSDYAYLSVYFLG